MEELRLKSCAASLFFRLHRTCNQAIGGHPGRIPALHGHPADGAFEAADLPARRDGFGTVVNRAAGARSMVRLRHVRLCVRSNAMTSTKCRPRLARVGSSVRVVQLMKRTTKATGNDPMMGFRAPPALRASIARWAETQPDNPSESEAVRRLVEMGLAVRPRSRQQSPKAAKANDIASRQLDRLADQAATPQEQASRKRRLLKGPEEFQGMRVDRQDTTK
jgi:hypothetical protein